MDALVSILIPAHNAGKTVVHSIESALAQSWTNKEVIIVDDGSTDSTLELSRRFEAKNVKVVSQERAGASAARNHAFRLAQGRFIQWLDADDLLAPSKIELQLKASGMLDDWRILSSSAWGRFIGHKDQAQFQPDLLWEDLTPAEWLFRKLDQNLWMAINAWLISRELSENAGPWNTELSRDDDGEYFCRVLCIANRVSFVPSAHSYVRRTNAASLSHNRSLSPARLHSLFQSLAAYVSALRRLEDSERTRRACVKLLQRWFIYFYPDRPELVEKSQAIAAELGYELAIPELRWKYRLIRRAFGWKAAKYMLFRGPKLQGLVARAFESVAATLDRSLQRRLQVVC